MSNGEGFGSPHSGATMYPLNVTRTDGEVTAFAVANDQAEHKALSDLGYLPSLEVTSQVTSQDTDQATSETVESARAKLDALGVEYDKRWGLSRLVALISA